MGIDDNRLRSRCCQRSAARIFGGDRTDKPEQAQASLEKFWRKRVARGAHLGSEPYLGVSIVSASESLASAVVGDRFVLLANHPKVLRDALNNAQVPDLNLSNSKPYQQVTKNLPAESLGLAVINLPQFATLWGNGIAAPSIRGSTGHNNEVRSAGIDRRCNAFVYLRKNSRNELDAIGFIGSCRCTEIYSARLSHGDRNEC
ncbi:MAG: DUF3352 domain-containing protein [Leptolyngbyaceae cyanobacterium CSU_1_4]|nr:DUF3352 domain-containing protein [Leptolyngbyaceae cyanobacterium CSU_1_4]